MGKLFHKRNKYSDEEFENEEFENEEFEDDDMDDEDDDDEIEDEEETEEEMDEEDEGAEEDDETDDEDEEDEDADEDDEDDDEEWEEDDRRTFRRRRRIRNQIISYSVVFVVMAAIIAGGVAVGRNIMDMIKEKQAAEEQAQLQAEQEAEEAHEVVIDAPETLDEPEEDILGELVAASLSDMPLEDKVAGLFIVTPEALTGVATATQAGEGTQAALIEYGIGGLIYFDKNILEKEQITDMLSSTVSKSRYPLFLAVDEEGGSVSRVAKSGIDVIQVDSMSSIGESGDTSQAYEAGLTIGTYLKELGFNLDFAPVADVAASGESALGDRVFGSDAQTAGDMVANVVEGIEGTGVSSCLKHFPGIGDAAEDTHDGKVESTKTLDEMRESNFLPFKAGIEAGADFVMVSHMTVPSGDEDAIPSSLSKTMITDVLRNELGFQGVVITDALNMGAITDYYTSEEAAVMAIEAGADMLLMPEDFHAAYDALLAAVQDGTIPEERINESLERIYRVKGEKNLAQQTQ